MTAEPTRPIRIVRVIARLNIGGPAIHTALLTRRLGPPAYDSLLVTGQPERDEGEMTDLVERVGIRRVVVPSMRQPLHLRRDLLAWWRLLGIIRGFRPDIVHTHTAKAGALGRSAALVENGLRRLSGWITGRPVGRCWIVHTFHGHVLEGYFSRRRSRIFLAIERWLARRTDRLIAVSQAARDRLLALGVGRAEQWRVIPPGLEIASLAELPFPNGQWPVTFGMVGRLVPIKNPTLFLHALSRLAQGEEGRPVSAVIVGDGPLRRQLEEEAAALGLARRVRFTGWQRDMTRVYQGLDVACLTSWSEGTPVAVIEAMAAGRAVIATDVGGVRDLLCEPAACAEGPPTSGSFRVGARGILVRPGDPEGLAAALAATAADQGLRRRLGAAARAHAVSRYSEERLIREIAAVYQELKGTGA